MHAAFEVVPGGADDVAEPVRELDDEPDTVIVLVIVGRSEEPLTSLLGSTTVDVTTDALDATLGSLMFCVWIVMKEAAEDVSGTWGTM